MNSLVHSIPTLLSLLKIEELGSINKAAQALHVSQPSLARSISRLEKLLEVKIFERTAKGVYLTSFGTVLMDHARIIDAEIRHTIETIDALKGKATNLLRIGTTPLVLTQILPAALEALRRDFPSISVKVIEGARPTLLQKLRLSEIDIVLATVPQEWDAPGIVSHALFSLNPCVVVKAGHPLTDKVSLKLHQLAVDQAWILPRSNGSVYEHISRTFRRAGAEAPVSYIEVGSADATKTLLQSTDLLGIMPEEIIANELSKGQLAVLRGDWRFANRIVTACFSKGSNRSKVAMQLLKCITIPNKNVGES